MQINSRFWRFSLLACCLGVSSCGSDSGSTSAPTSTTPNVAGNYSGTVAITLTSAGQSINCPASMTVNQSGANITMSPLSLGGACQSSLPSIPMGSTTVSNTGSIGNATQTNVSVPSCGFYNTNASGGFFGNSFQFSVFYTAVSPACQALIGNFSFTGTLTH